MAAERPPSAPRDSLSADLIAQRGFAVSRRGYDRTEVKDFLRRVADEVLALRDRITELEQARRDAEERAQHPMIDEDTLMVAVGEETAAILRTARNAASDLRTRAEADALRTLEQAREEAEATRTAADEALGVATQEADAAAQDILGGARTDAEAQVSRARREAEEIRQQAEQDRKLTVEGAQAIREKILADLSRRRRVATVQIEQLRAGRERLLEAYAVVRRTLEEVNTELQRADAEARAAADDVVRHEVGESVGDRGETGSDEPADAGDDLAGPAAGAAAAGSTATGSTAGTETAGSEAAGTEAAGSEAHGAAVPEGSVGSVEGSVQGSVEGLGAASDAEGADGATMAEPSVEGLFARIRAGREEATRAVGGVADVADVEEEDDEAQVRSEGDERLLARRDRATVDIELSLARKLKRALQDEQNALLDRLRGLRAEPSSAALLVPSHEHAARFSNASRPLLERSARAGVAFGLEEIGATGTPAPEPATPVPVDDLADQLAESITVPLRRRLEQAILDAKGDDQSVLVDSFGAAYREWKTQRIERAAGDHVAAAFARGTWHAAPDGTVLRWVVEDLDGPCPDCDDDALAGGLAKGEPFPTGQLHPPAHAGCRCLLVPGEG
jgi:DivIVA domain-containing protein